MKPTSKPSAAPETNQESEPNVEIQKTAVAAENAVHKWQILNYARQWKRECHFTLNLSVTKGLYGLCKSLGHNLSSQVGFQRFKVKLLGLQHFEGKLEKLRPYFHWKLGVPQGRSQGEASPGVEGLNYS